MPVREHRAIQRREHSDASLVGLALAGDQYAFECLVHRYQPALYHHIFRYLREYEETCDMLQEVFTQLYLSLASFRLDVCLKGWLYTVARNRCLDVLRRKRRSFPFSQLNGEDLTLLLAISDTASCPEYVAERWDIQQSLHRAIHLLPTSYRSVVLLRYTDQLSFSEIGRVLHMPSSTAKTYFYRAKALLRAILKG